MLIPDQEDGVAYTSFLNGLRSGGFKFFLADQKERMLAKALWKLADFLRDIEICADSSDTSKKTKAHGDRGLNRGKSNPTPRDRRP